MILIHTMSARYSRQLSVNDAFFRGIYRCLSSYKPSQLYRVVSDVNSYPRFLPFCAGARVLSKTIPKDPSAMGRNGAVKMQAEMTVGFMALKEHYVSDVTCIPYESVAVRFLNAALHSATDDFYLK